MSNLLWEMTKFKNALDTLIYLSQVSAWHGHIPFAFFISEVIRPTIMVELGVHNGDSYIAFLQGLRAAGEPGKAYGIDTWTGDEHSGHYPEHIYPQLKGLHDPVFGHFSTLLRGRFEEQVDLFSDGSIDLLHIDGCHTYEAVSRDLEMWLPKVSPRGVVLLHDTVIKTGDFGVWKKWGELKKANRFFDFFHSNGLGVLMPGDEPHELLIEMSHVNSYSEGEWIRNYFSLLAERINAQWAASHGSN